MRDPSFFNQKNPDCQVMQLINLAASAKAIYELFTNSEALYTESGLDVLTHAVSFVALQQNKGAGYELGSFSLNSARLGALYMVTASSGSSSFTMLVNIMDVSYHI